MAMLVTFESSETGELFMYAEVARMLFDIVGKEHKLGHGRTGPHLSLPGS